MKCDIVRAWKDDNYRQSLSAEELALLPANPAGEIELNETELESVYGGGGGSLPPSVSPAVAPAHSNISTGGNVVGSTPVGGGAGIVGGGAVGALTTTNSVAVLCELNLFSLNLVNAAVLGAVTNICVNHN